MAGGEPQELESAGFLPESALVFCACLGCTRHVHGPGPGPGRAGPGGAGGGGGGVLHSTNPRRGPDNEPAPFTCTYRVDFIKAPSAIHVVDAPTAPPGDGFFFLISIKKHWDTN